MYVLFIDYKIVEKTYCLPPSTARHAYLLLHSMYSVLNVIPYTNFIILISIKVYTNLTTQKLRNTDLSALLGEEASNGLEMV